MKHPKITLASYPRSGNTFLRNILYQVYGLDSIGDVDVASVDNWKKSNTVFIKTHELPEVHFNKFGQHTVIYLIRDGRDALVSQAYHRINIIKPGDDYLQILREAILAKAGSYFGGWAEHNYQWTRHADVIIRFEDLITNPKTQLQKIDAVFKLPKANWSKLPTFNQLKKGKEQFVEKTKILGVDNIERRRHELFFRKGQPGEWKTQMPKDLQILFWKKASYVMKAYGYRQNQDPVTDIIFDEIQKNICRSGIKKPWRIRWKAWAGKLMDTS